MLRIATGFLLEITVSTASGELFQVVSEFNSHFECALNVRRVVYPKNLFEMPPEILTA